MLIQFVLVISLLLALYTTWRRAVQNIISRSEAAGWSVVWIAAAIVILLPQTTTTVANFFGVGRGVDFVLYASVLALFFLVFKIFITLDRLDRKLTEIVRQDALRDVKNEKT